MKKSVIALIVAAALLCAGGLLIFFGLTRTNFDLAEKPVDKVYTAPGSFQSIQIDTGSCDVRFYKTDKYLTVHCPETEQLEYIVMVEDGVLRISAMDMRRWYDFIGIHQPDRTVTVYLPEDSYESLQIQTDAGDIQIPQDFSFDSVEISSSVGDIDLAAKVTDRLRVTNSTGQIRIQNTAAQLLEVSLSTGRIDLKNMLNCGDIRLIHTTGELQATNVTCRNLTCEGSTGDTELTDVVVAEAMRITGTTSEVELEDCDAGSVTIKTSTGDVSGHFRTPKWFIPQTSTGDVEVPLNREGGECRITTSTGDIEFF